MDSYQFIMLNTKEAITHGDNDKVFVLTPSSHGGFKFGKREWQVSSENADQLYVHMHDMNDQVSVLQTLNRYDFTSPVV